LRAGRSISASRYIYLIYFTGIGQYQPSGRATRIIFEEWAATLYLNPVTSPKTLVVTRKDNVKVELTEILNQRLPCPPSYKSLCQYAQNSLVTESRLPRLDALVAAAKDAVQYTIDRDPSYIGGDIVPEVVEALPGALGR
jgi:hypothetical protein